MGPKKFDPAADNESLEPLDIIELDDRLELAADPLFQLADGCCGNDGCICPKKP